MSIDCQYQLERLLNKVNRITSAHRHRKPISNTDLDALSNRQIEVEQAISSKQSEAPSANAGEKCSWCGGTAELRRICVICY